MFSFPACVHNSLPNKMTPIVKVGSFECFLTNHIGFGLTCKAVLVNAIKAVKLGLLSKDSENVYGECLGFFFVHNAFFSQSWCLPIVSEFFEMEPCLFKIWICLIRRSSSHPFLQFCTHIPYLWTNAQAFHSVLLQLPKTTLTCDLLRQHWMYCTNWSPCRVAWIRAVVV